MAGSLAAVAVVGLGRDGPGLAVRADAFEAPTATTTTTRATGVVLAELPIPGPLPLRAHEPAPEVVLGRLEIPKLEVDEPFQQGMTLTAINRGPSHWPGTALPGEVGNVVVAGHRVTYSRPFHRLDELAPGDQVVFRMADGGVHTYEVTQISVIGPDDLWIADQTYAHTATLFACHPKGSARQRIVASLRLLGPDGRAVDEVTPPLSDVRREAYTDELFVMAPDQQALPGQPANLSAPGVEVRHRAADTVQGRDLVPGAPPGTGVDWGGDGGGEGAAMDPLAEPGS